MELSQEQKLYFKILEDLHKNWKPHPGQLAVGKAFLNGDLDTLFLQCGRKFGKCLNSLEYLITPDGKKQIKDIVKGDILFDIDGKPTKVLDVSDIYTDNPCYELLFSDGTKLIADLDHKWIVENRNSKVQKVFTTRELLNSKFNAGWNRIPLCKPVEFEHKILPIDPYVLGFWIGDGASKSGEFYTDDYWIVEEIRRRGYEVSENSNNNLYYIKGIHKILKELDIYKNKHIPHIYKYSSVKQRLDLVRGILDADGWAKGERGSIGFVQKNINVFNDTVDLLRSLGNSVTVCEDKIVNGKSYKELYCAPTIQCFGLPRKALKIKHKLKDNRRQFKRIVSINLTNTVDVKCLSVDSPTHSYLTKDYTVTHNTEIAVYFLWRHALLNPGSSCYYVTPEFSHGRKIVWHDPRLTSFCDNSYLDSINNNECMVKFKNKSFIQIIGSENFQSANGLRPGILVYDEFCEFNPRFHETMNPNRVVNKCPLIIIGTPPLAESRNKEQYLAFAAECQEDPKSLWVTKTSYDNPFIDPLWLDKERKKLFARGEEYLWYSQYEAKLTSGGKHVIFPMLNRETHVKSHDKIISELSRDASKLQWFRVADPGTTTVMAVLFGAINPYTKKIYLLDEIYERDAKLTSVQQIVPIIEKKCLELAPRVHHENWESVYDEAAAWFANEVMQQFGYFFAPTLKAHNKKDNGISLIKDILLNNVIIISDKCVKLLWEMESYVADEQGKFPKTNDHLIDCFRYLLAAANYTMVEMLEAKRKLLPRNINDLPTSEHSAVQRYDDPWEGEDWTAEFD